MLVNMAAWSGSASGRENLELQGRIYGLSKEAAKLRAAELIKVLNLTDFADRLVETYSGGQRRRCDLALGMVHKPKLLFLDEPTVGLDPQSRAYLWEEIKQLRNRGTTIFLTTHYLDEADVLCDRIAIVDKGKLIALDTPTALKRQIGHDVVVLGLPAQQVEQLNVDQVFSGLSDIREIIKEREAIRFLVHHGEALLPTMLRRCDAAQLTLSTISLHHPTLDDVFLQKTGHSFIQQ
jgi:ABC-2 type transport system ATP-binding protein